MIELPKIKLNHLNTMTDSFALIQHSVLSEPDASTGYTVDDNSRALIAMLLLNDFRRSKKVVQLCEKYASFLEFAQMPNGWFHNHFSENKKPVDRRGSADCLGRALWACGAALNSKRAPLEIKEKCRSIFEKAKPNIRKLNDTRSISFSLLGCCETLRAFPRNKKIEKIALKLSSALAGNFGAQRFNGWRWFEPFLTYSNARMPQSLFEASSVLEKPLLKKVAVSSFSFLEKKTMFGNTLVLVGQRGWLHRGSKRAFYDQQPVDAGAMVEASISGLRATGNQCYWNTALNSFDWFFGKNSSGHKLYNARNGACYDGLGKDGVNLNQGAESTLAYLLARISIEEEMKKQQLFFSDNA